MSLSRPTNLLGNFFIKHRNGLFVHPYKGQGKPDGYLVLACSGDFDNDRDRLLFCFEDRCIKHCRSGLFIHPQSPAKDDVYLVLKVGKPAHAHFDYRQRYLHHVESGLIVHPRGGQPVRDAYLCLHGDGRSKPEERLMFELVFETPRPPIEIRLVDGFARTRQPAQASDVTVAALVEALVHEINGFEQVPDISKPPVTRGVIGERTSLGQLKAEIDRYYFTAMAPSSSFQPDEQSVIKAAYLLVNYALEITMELDQEEEFFIDQTSMTVAAYICGWLQEYNVVGEDINRLHSRALACLARFCTHTQTLPRFRVIGAS